MLEERPSRNQDLKAYAVSGNDGVVDSYEIVVYVERALSSAVGGWLVVERHSVPP